jgi:hypothetical protein
MPTAEADHVECTETVSQDLECFAKYVSVLVSGMWQQLMRVRLRQARRPAANFGQGRHAADAAERGLGGCTAGGDGRASRVAGCGARVGGGWIGDGRD